MSGAVGVQRQLKVFTDRTGIEQEGGPVSAAEVDLMKRTVRSPHQAPFNPVWRDFELNVRWRNVFKNRPSMPCWPFPVHLARPCKTAHLEVVPVGVEDTREFVGRNGDSTIHKSGGVGGSDGVDKRRAPKPVGAMNRRPDRSLLGRPAVMFLVRARQFHVGCPVMFRARVVQLR